ncbi:MAG: LamG-like jellyroll fold domain-containing protein [Verrucomicrobiales bacterium]
MRYTPNSAVLMGLALLVSALAHAELTNYWPLSEAAGDTAPNSVATGSPAYLLGTVVFSNDPLRGAVLAFDGAGYVEAGTLPEFLADDSFTWSFWANSTQGPNNNVIVGNRYPDTGWIKFTTNAFEFRDISPTYNGTIDYPNFPTAAWVHHAVVKAGPLFTYYRNGLALRQLTLTADAPSVPLYFGGDMFVENWAGLLDDVATWSSALPTSSIASLFAGTTNPSTAPLVPNPPTTVPALTDSFDTLAAWTPADRGLESKATSTYDPPAILGGELILGGTTNAQYWLGSSVVSNQAFDSRLYTEVELKRVSLSGSGTAYRSSLWIFGDDSHYLHFSQNVGENGWQFNANDGTGQGTLNQVGSGNNIAGLDALDADTGPKVMSVRILPVPGISGQVNMEMLVDGQVYAVHGFNQFPTTFKVILTGQARAIGDTVAAVFDDVRVRRENVANLPPSFSPTSAVAPALNEGGSLAFNAAALASDAENNPLTFTKSSGPDWVTVSAAGQLSGTAPAGSAGLVEVVVRALDTVGLGTAQFTLRFRVQPPSLSAPLLGWWPLNEGTGAIANDVSGNAADGFIQNPETGGLGDNGSAWFNDPTHGPVLSFNGNDSTVDPAGTFVIVGDPPGAYALPPFTLEDSFSWSLWVRPEQSANNDIILGNRFDSNGVDFVPREFVKFTSHAFEWHFNGGGENIDYPDLPASAWMHLVAIKEGSRLYYYRDGTLIDTRTITGVPASAQPLYFAGQGVENWRGYLADIRLYTGSLSEQTVTELFADGPGGPGAPVEPPRITEVTRASNGSVTLTWTSEAGEQFDVQWSTTLGTGAWSVVSGTLTATGTTTSFTLPAGGNPDPATIPAGYLRVRRLGP